MSQATAAIVDRVERASKATTNYLFSQQREDGHWCAELQGDTLLESEYVILHSFLGVAPSDPKIQALCRYLWKERVPGVGWVQYPGGTIEVSGSVKAYLALKFAGYPTDSPEMSEARELILRAGGVDACNSFTKFYLAMVGQYDWRDCPAVPPELFMAPHWLYFNIYSMSEWSRVIVTPLSLIFSKKPVHKMPVNIDELYLDGRRGQRPSAGFSKKLFSWKNFWTVVNKLLWVHESLPWKPLRATSKARAERWMVERIEGSDGLGAIFPPIVNSIIAFLCQGYTQDHPHIVKAMKELEDLEIWEGDTLRVQPCKSPVWDTVISMIALQEAGVAADHPGLLKAADWVMQKQSFKVGDWKVFTPHAEPGGWSFFYNEPWHPDNDDTTYALTALARVKHPEQARHGHSVRQGLQWLLAMQNSDGSWSSYDRNNNRVGLEFMPFADHNAMIDPGTADITARVVETLSHFGYTPDSNRIRRALDFVYARQESDGSYWGRWGVNYIYGTWQVLKGLASMGVSAQHPTVSGAVEWLKSVQKPDGGWGETVGSYDDPNLKSVGESTPSQTAWALMGLLSGGESPDSEAVAKGFEYLTSTQKEDGSWDEHWWTGTGFPKVFYLRYHYYKIYFPLFAFGMYLQKQGRLSKPTVHVQMRPRA